LGGNGTGIQNDNTSVIPATAAAASQQQPVTKSDTFITATINNSRFANNDTIAVNGTVGGQAMPSNTGRLYVELRDPNNETVMYDATKVTTTGNSKTPFSYNLLAGDLERNTTSAITGDHRIVYKPMNMSGLNYTMAVGYRMPGTSLSEVQFVFAYDHGDGGGLAGGLLGDEPTTVASRFAGNNTTTATTTTADEPVIPTPRPVLDQPEEEDDDDDDSNDDDGSDDDDNGDDDSDEGDDNEEADDGDGGNDDGEEDDDVEDDGDAGDGDAGDGNEEDTDDADDSEEDDTEEEEEESGEALTILKEVLTENRDVLHQKPPRWQDGE
jgi:hypothetical protein